VNENGFLCVLIVVTVTQFDTNILIYTIPEVKGHIKDLMYDIVEQLQIPQPLEGLEFLEMNWPMEPVDEN
jgi:hypothetical protein